MKRLIWSELLAWKERKDRKPLILRGVRQSGKTWLLKAFGKECFPDHIYLNFDRIWYRSKSNRQIMSVPEA